MNGEKRNQYRLFMEKPERKRPLGRPRSLGVSNYDRIWRQEEVVCTGLIWDRIGTSRGLL
jgi:hypothetical protein